MISGLFIFDKGLILENPDEILNYYKFLKNSILSFF